MTHALASKNILRDYDDARRAGNDLVADVLFRFIGGRLGRARYRRTISDEEMRRLHRRYLLGATLEELGTRVNLTRERIRQLFHEAGLSRGYAVRRERSRRPLRPLVVAERIAINNRHGTSKRYQHLGCRCSACTQANTLRCMRFRYERDLRAGKPVLICFICAERCWFMPSTHAWRHTKKADHQPEPTPLNLEDLA